MAGNFTWLSLSAGISQLGARLAAPLTDPPTSLWSATEGQNYIFRALQIFNILTNTWRTDFTFNSPNLWNSLGSLAGSPRLRTATDTASYKMLEWYLLEPPTGGGAWTGTSQFSLSDLQNALQSRRNEMLQISACNDILLQNIPLTPNTRRTFLPDTTLDCIRVRYLALDTSPAATGVSGANSITVSSSTNIAAGQLVSGTGIALWATVTSVSGTTVTLSLPNTAAVSGVINFYTPNDLYRDDTVALEWYESPLYQLPSGTPQTFQLSSEPPLSFDVDITPNQPGVYEALVSQSGTPFAPPASTLLGIPDDWAFVLEYGALADLLGRESEATDRERAAYCFPAGTKIAMGDTSLKSIEDVKEGEIVVTHTGERHKVTELIPSERISTICKISSFGFEDIEATEEHPFLVIPYSWRKTQTKKVKITRDKFLRGKAASWLMAKEISDGDIVMRPIEPVHNNSKTNDEYGWLLGIYLAEGGVSSSREGLPPKSSRFEFHIAEQDFADRVIELSKAMDVESTYSIYKRSWANSFTLRINSKKVAGWLLEMGGKGAKTKSLSSKVYGFGEAFIRKVIKGWADGDGNFPSRKCPSHKKMNRVLRVATASLTLANQMQSLAASVGVVARVSKIERMTNIAYQVIWMVIFQSDAADAVLEERGPCLVSNYSKIFIYNGYLCSHVSSVSRRTYHGKLYNFSVDKDNSYIANGYAVHNCLKRYQDYLTVITKTPWIMLGSVNGVACSVDSLEETDLYSVGWDLNPTDFGPVIVTAGTDFLASPVGHSCGVTVLGNAPLLDTATSSYLQVSKDSWNTVLDLAQSLASFKLAGSEWKAALELEARAIKFASAENSRLKSLGAFTDVILQRGQAQDRAQNRYDDATESKVRAAHKQHPEYYG